MEVKYLSDNGEFKTLEISDLPSSPTNGGAFAPETATRPTDFSAEEASEKKVWKTDLVSVSGVPEIKIETCHRRVRIPGDGNINVPYPCTCTRTGRHWIELKVFYPSDLAGDVIDNIIKCAKEAAMYAAGIIAVSCIAPVLLPPAVPTAQALFIEKFKSCLAEETFKLVDYSVSYEHESGDWNC
ncbi:hypothetical protein [Bacillus atrophaeus]|uniref:hypothetical protein n=1 Tax=Bacillus atrophaeus TaxID=1452 RepID=UPI00227E9D90|nr:hypothetical protein [Bacillus atrophaeus]MCY8513534.1 hypothetical protein [Bacillus atrophaeus]MCY8992638.1 hypothetical protein [Bacillus atrophaeus]